MRRLLDVSGLTAGEAKAVIAVGVVLGLVLGWLSRTSAGTVVVGVVALGVVGVGIARLMR